MEIATKARVLGKRHRQSYNPKPEFDWIEGGEASIYVEENELRKAKNNTSRRKVRSRIKFYVKGKEKIKNGRTGQ